MNKNSSNLLILIGIIPTFSENFIQIKCGLSYTLKCNPRLFSECTNFASFYYWQSPKMHFGGCHWLSGNLILIEKWNCPQLNVQFIIGSLQNAFFEYKVHVFVQFSKKTTYKAETPIHIMKSGTPVCVISCLKVIFKKLLIIMYQI